MPKVALTDADNHGGKVIRNKETREIMSEWPVDVKPLIDFDKKMGLIWSAKSACSLSVLWFFAVTGRLREALAHDKWPHVYRGEVFNHLQFTQARDNRLTSAQTRWVRVMRDPFKRAVSSYRHFLLHDIEREQGTAFFGAPVEERGLSFDEFLTYLETRDINLCDIHLRQQWTAVEEFCLQPTIINADTSDVEQKLFSIFKADEENIQLFIECRDWIFPFHNAKVEKIPDVNSSTVIKKGQVIEKWPGFLAFENTRTREMVRKIYDEDYRRFNSFI